ncbi:hypothetical protein NLG97_g5724 [Lecanicillium saksenae]|uniref:Uncharacterized protein n=1 Tax=Lecanicillium saksenae TaxID=468837 RepID=A0ACC1QTJ7_9HYPO|nr:hypothetical protein NLG97_g5724 [Lecanicillium saksenae]
MGVHEQTRLIAPAFPPRSIRTVVLSFFGTCLFFSFYSLSRMPEASRYPYYIYDHIANYFEPGVYNNTLYQNGTEAAVHAHWNFSEPCQNFPSMDDVMVVMKTGATESFEKMPTQLLTGLQCIPDFLLFSDLEQQIGKYHIYNALDGVEDILTSDRTEFLLYQAQQDCPVSQKECTNGMNGGWDLDKYKFLSMVLRTWEMRPDRKWYVFVEADTYIVWSNLIEWLNTRMDASEDVYVGGIAFLGNLPFAHGGTGYAISGVLLNRLVSRLREIPTTKLIEMGTRTCCGDALLAEVIDKYQEVSVQRASPMFNGEKPNTLPFGPRDWCQPLFTMHHMNSEEISAVWQYEQTRTKKDPLQLRDIYHAFVGPNLVPRRPKWNNLAEQRCFEKPEEGRNVIERHAHESVEACSRVCLAEDLSIDEGVYEKLETEDERDLYLQQRYVQHSGKSSEDRNCFSWRYREGKCCISDTIRLGYPVRAKNEGDATSGWFVDGIERWIAEHGQCSEGTEWVKAECVGKWCPEEVAKRKKQSQEAAEKQKQRLQEQEKAEAAKTGEAEGEETLR